MMDFQQTFFYYVQKIILFLPIGLLAYFSPLVELAGALCILIIFNTVSGIWASITNHISFKWNVFLLTFVKMFAFSIALLSSFVFDNHIINSADIWATRSVVLVLASFELESILKNIYKITGVKIWENIKHLFNKAER